ncbi:type III polyketide synthase [Phycisphaera mikurensis]|uniref:Putative type III polyketide synthase n=1 Tax=Phycisphaera mikurensis (strain NBRC 102666 / KCTC 22515 / FYK2301M01) TaxID=1142394 RepID=I0IGY0_PHYMF|nr:polyketide synthase [Phycisphaera mikurensis]MBB6440775.1 putative naringenin-chalcone synthase [Phycisphaera mikurensis]BAM04518.1 putative type III polyketide synthase [Phycisphaera mikurensis NBRC 102666]
MSGRPRIAGLGTALPGNSVPQAALAEAAASCCSPRVARLLPRLYARSGVERRGCAVFPAPGVPADRDAPEAYVAAIRGVFAAPSPRRPLGPGVAERMRMYRDAALPLAAEAARDALADAGAEPAAIDHLVTVSCTGFAAPGVDLALLGTLGLPPATSRTHVGFMGCHGAMNGLRVAGALAAAEPGCRVLLVCVEVCTAHFRYGDAGLTANALFADGAAAAVVTADAGRGRSLTGRASLVLPGSADAMTWAIGAHGFEMSLSPAVPALIAERLPGVIGPWLARHGLTPAGVAGWAIHPGGPRVIDAVGEALGLGPAALAPSHALLREHGNMSSPTVLFLVDRLRRSPGPLVALAFGPGLTAEAALLG